MPKRMKLNFKGGANPPASTLAPAPKSKKKILIIAIIAFILIIGVISCIVYFSSDSDTTSTDTSASGTPSTPSPSPSTPSPSPSTPSPSPSTPSPSPSTPSPSTPSPSPSTPSPSPSTPSPSTPSPSPSTPSPSTPSPSTDTPKPYALDSSITGKTIFEPDSTLGSGYISGCPLMEIKALGSATGKLDKLASDDNKRYNVTESSGWTTSTEKMSKYNDNIYVGSSRGGDGDNENLGKDGPAKCAQYGDIPSNKSNPCKQIVKNPDYSGSESLDCSKFYYYRPSGAPGWGFYPCVANSDNTSCDVSKAGRFL